MSEVEMETWENPTNSRVVLKKFNAKGELTDQLFGGRTKIHLTPQERRINQELAAMPSQDMFQNGMLCPVRLVDDEDDTLALAANPNNLPESEMVALIKGNLKGLKAKLEDITNVLTLQRMVEIAKEMDASVSKVTALSDRLDSLAESEVRVDADADEMKLPGFRFRPL